MATETKDKDLVKITCYGETEEMERDKAIAFYKQGVEECDGSERDRYMNILEGLEAGLNEVDDGEEDW